MQLHKFRKERIFLRYVRSICLLTIFLMISLAIVHPVVMGEKEIQPVIVDMTTEETSINGADEIRNHLDKSVPNTGMEVWSEHFISLNADVPSGVYYGTMLHEYLTNNVISHRFVESYEENYGMNMVWFQNKFTFGRNMIMSGASEFWVKLPVTGDSIRSFSSEINSIKSTCTASGSGADVLCEVDLDDIDPLIADYIVTSALPVLHLNIWEDGNKDDTFFHRPIIVDVNADSASSVLSGVAIVDNNIYVRVRYPILPDKVYIFELIFFPSEGKTKFYLTDEITTLSTFTEVFFSEMFLGLDTLPTRTPADDDAAKALARTKKDFMRDYLFDNFVTTETTESEIIPPGLQPVWNFMFTQGMDEGMFGVRQVFNPGDTLVISPYVKATDDDGAQRMHMFVPWINNRNEEFNVDVRLEVDETEIGGGVVFNAGPVKSTEVHSQHYWDTRDDGDNSGDVDGDRDGTTGAIVTTTPWKTLRGLRSKLTFAGNEKTDRIAKLTLADEYVIFTGGDTTTSSQINTIEFAVGTQAVEYYHGTKINGIFFQGLDTKDLYEEMNYIRKNNKGSGKYTDEEESDPDSSWYMGVQTEEFAPGEINFNDPSNNFNTQEQLEKQKITYKKTSKNAKATVTNAHFTLWYKDLDGNEFQVFDSDGRSNFNEDPTLTGSANTFTFSFNTATEISEVFVRDIRGPIAYRKIYTKQTVKPEQSEGIPVKDFLLFTIPTHIFAKQDIGTATGLSGTEWYYNYKLYITFKEGADLTFLAHMVDHERESWPHKWQNDMNPPFSSRPGFNELGDGYWNKGFLTAYDGFQGGYYGLIATGTEDNQDLADEFKTFGYYEPLGYEIFGVLDYSADLLRWDVGAFTAAEALSGDFGNREFSSLNGFRTVAFTGVYKSLVYIPEEDIVKQVTLLDGKSFESKDDLVASLGNNIWDLIVAGLNALHATLIQIADTIIQGIVWLVRQISNFFGEIFNIITSILDEVSSVISLVLILFILAAFAYINALTTRFMDNLRRITQKISGTVRRAVDR